MITGLEPSRRSPYNYATHYAKKSRKFIRVWGRFKGALDCGYRTPVIVHTLVGGAEAQAGFHLRRVQRRLSRQSRIMVSLDRDR